MQRAELPTDFWEQARVALEKVKPDIMLLAEANKPDLLKSAFDIDYSWPLMHTLNDVIMNGEPATAIRATVEQQQALFPIGALHMRISDDHDELRATTRYSYPGAIAASALIFTLDGAPLDLQRNGGRRLYPVRRSRALRTAENLLGCSDLASGLSEVLRGNRRAAQNASRTRAGRACVGS